MSRAISQEAIQPAQRDALRQELLKLILKNEAQRRDQQKANDK